MKTKNLIILVVIVIVLFAWGSSVYNGMVGAQESATTELANVQSAYQRRADLIPNLVETVKGYAAHEKETLEGVVEARSKATGINLSAEDLTPEKLQQFQEAQSGLSSALNKLLAIRESYPELKANENFRDLQVQLEGTENRINQARNTYNKAVETYNAKVRRFPNNIFAGLFGFDKMTKFEAEAGAEKAPQVKF